MVFTFDKNTNTLYLFVCFDFFFYCFQQLPQHLRAKAANSMYFEAQCRLADPVYGCVKTISLLRQQIDHAHSQLAIIQAEIALYQAQIHGDNNQIQNADHQLPVSRFYNYLAADQGNGFPHPTPPTPSIQPPMSM